MNAKKQNFISSINSMAVRGELIKKSFDKFNCKAHKTKSHYSKKDLEFAKCCKDFLPDHERIVVHLHFWEELSLIEISHVLHVSFKLVDLILQNAIKRLRSIYEDHFPNTNFIPLNRRIESIDMKFY